MFFGKNHHICLLYTSIVLVGNTGHDAKPLLQALGELVGGGFQRGSIEGVVDVLGLFPGIALVVHVLHHAQSKGLCTGIGVALRCV